MRSLRWVGLVSSLLIVGVLGGLMAPLPSEAAPTLTLDGSNVGLTQIACADAGYNSCWSLNGTSPRTIGVWKVGDVSGTNKARLLIADNSAAGSLDLMKLTGVTFTPVVTAGTKVATVVIKNTYNVGGGNPVGNYLWGLGFGGQFDPPAAENVVGSGLKLVATGKFPGLSDMTPLTLQKSPLGSPTINNLNGSITSSLAASVVKPNCNTGSNKCAPTITHTFTITVNGADTLFLTDSFVGAGGTCRDQGHPPNVPNGPAGPLCKHFLQQVDKIVQDDLSKELLAAQANGAAPATTCVDPTVCGTGSIVITKTIAQFYEPDGFYGSELLIPKNIPQTFGFTGTGAGIGTGTGGTTPYDFDLVTEGTGEAIGTGSVTFSNLPTDGNGGVRIISETVFSTIAPLVSDPLSLEPDGDDDAFWFTKSVSCTPEDDSETPGATHYTASPGAADSDPLLRRGSVTVHNLKDGDTLHCTFENGIFEIEPD